MKMRIEIAVLFIRGFGTAAPGSNVGR
jgi:hypothetical protein